MTLRDLHVGATVGPVHTQFNDPVISVTIKVAGAESSVKSQLLLPSVGLCGKIQVLRHRAQ